MQRVGIVPWPNRSKLTSFPGGQWCKSDLYHDSFLKDWTIVDRLHQVDVRTLVINGRFDIAQDYVTAAYVESIPGAKWIKFENSSHTPCWEEKEEYMKVIGEFLGD